MTLNDKSFPKGKLGLAGYRIKVQPSPESSNGTKELAELAFLLHRTDVTVSFKNLKKTKLPEEYDLTQPVIEENSVTPENVMIRIDDKTTSLKDYVQWESEVQNLRTNLQTVTADLSGLTNVVSSYVDGDRYKQVVQARIDKKTREKSELEAKLLGKEKELPLGAYKAK